MKKIILSAALLITIVAAASASRYEVNEKVLKAFNETFTKAQDVVWHEYDNMYQANFKQDDIQIRAQYDQEGTLIQTIRYYGERQLLPNIVSKLKKKYGTREIFGVTETSSDEGVAFLVTLKDEKNWYVVKSDVYGNLEQTEKFKRADN
jgi:copper oxidase (laccase) domain-containing protein